MDSHQTIQEYIQEHPDAVFSLGDMVHMISRLPDSSEEFEFALRHNKYEEDEPVLEQIAYEILEHNPVLGFTFLLKCTPYRIPASIIQESLRKRKFELLVFIRTRGISTVKIPEGSDLSLDDFLRLIVSTSPDISTPEREMCLRLLQD